MSYMEKNRGGSPVGVMEELPKLEATIIRYLRLWCDTPESQTEVWRDFYAFFGRDEARNHMVQFETLLSNVMIHSRRPLQRHQVRCSCVGGDENAFANFVVAATMGEREDALLFAINFMRPDMAMTVVNLAGPVGLTLSQMIQKTAMPEAFSNISNTKH